jgi:hypothetical protein
MLELESVPTPQPFNHPSILFSTSNPPLCLRKATSNKTRRTRTYIIHFILVRSQYPKLNFSYQSGLFSYDYFLIKLALLGDCTVN